MSKLREKFEECIFISWDMKKKSIEIEKEKKAIKCEQITDDAMIKFAVWKEENVTKLKDNNYMYYGLIYTDLNELLQIFKDNFYE